MQMLHIGLHIKPWQRHDMETRSALLALSVENPWLSTDSPHKCLLVRSFDFCVSVEKAVKEMGGFLVI